MLLAETHTFYLLSMQARLKMKLRDGKYASEEAKQRWEDLNSLRRAE